MPTLHNREHDITDFREPRSESRERDSDRDIDRDEREISLGTGTILGIFFALALVCAVFFGLGYSMGRKSAQPTAPVASAELNTAPQTASTTFKPSAGSPVAASGQVPPPTAKSEAAGDGAKPQPMADPDANIVTRPVTRTEIPVEAATVKPKPPSPSPRATTAPDGTASAALHPATQTTTSLAPAMPAISPNGTTMVQVAAVSHQEDADVLISALKKRGYAVVIRQEPQDHLLHVQVGPFASRKDADAMRQRLLSDGYNAIVK